MMERCESFISQLSEISGAIEMTYKNVMNQWHPEQPPLTTLFAALGDRVATQFENASDDENSRIFSFIELAMESGDEVLMTAVASGLIEALVSRAVPMTGLWEKIAPLLGPRSRHHADAWLSI